jgi:4-deoxy-L-threo-5-hexosulose-uronate ketol-isomerase
VDVRYSTNPAEARGYGTALLRRHYLVEDVFVPGELRLTYSHEDRVVLGGAMPGAEPLRLEPDDALRTDHFCERRELAAFCVGGRGAVNVDGIAYRLERGDLVYIGRGAREISFISEDQSARFYLASAPAHRELPTTLIKADDVTPIELGATESANARTIRRYIDGTLVQSCQLMRGWIQLGEPGETRHLIVRNEQAVISPAWSVHSGAATGSYSFIWFMAGENYRFDDMDHIAMADLR